MAQSTYIRRRRMLWKLIAGEQPGFVALAHPPNLRYFCGFTGSSGVLVLDERQAHFFTDGRYTEQARREVRDAAVVIETKPWEAARAWLAERKLGGIGIEGNTLSFAQAGELASALRPGGMLRDVTPAISQARMVKDRREIAAVRAAARLGSSLFEVALKAIRPGARESEIAAAMEFAARAAGAEGMAFSTIVAGGARSALPHGRASQAPLPRRGFVVLDFGVILAGYCSDMTRTVHLGKPSERASKMYAAVRRAQRAAIRAARRGRRFSEVDAAARRVLGRAGLGRYFTHSTGHGVGLEIHEPPRLGAGQEGRLQPGMVITIEPGVYVPGVGGVRIEDMVLINRRGAEVLTSGAKDLLVL